MTTDNDLHNILAGTEPEYVADLYDRYEKLAKHAKHLQNIIDDWSPYIKAMMRMYQYPLPRHIDENMIENIHSLPDHPELPAPRGKK